MADNLKWINASSTTFDKAALVLGAMGSKTIGVGIIASAYSSTSGYVKFANGLLIQWGKTTKISTQGSFYIPLVAYTHIPIVICDYTYPGTTGYIVHKTNVQKTSFAIQYEYFYQTGGLASVEWFAIGY